MADFDRIFAESGAKDVISDTDYDAGWNNIAGGFPPTKAQFNALQNESDLKAQDLNNTKVSKSGGTMSGNLSLDLGVSAASLRLQNNSGIVDLLCLSNANFWIRQLSAAGSVEDEWIHCTRNGGVESYYNNVKKLETTSTGIDVTGNLAITGTVDGRDVAVDGAKLDTIDTSATATGENILINGNFKVNQRSFAGGQPAAGVYGFDRWKGDVTGTRIQQVVENSDTLSGTYVISWVGGTGTADVDGTTGLNSGSTLTMTATGNYSVIVPTDATEIKFEKGSVSTSYVARPIAEELALCQRYYVDLPGVFRIRYRANGVGVVNPARVGGPSFPVAMRVAPAVTLLGLAISNTSSLLVDSLNINGFNVAYAETAINVLTSFSFTCTADAEL